MVRMDLAPKFWFVKYAAKIVHIRHAVSQYN